MKDKALTPPPGGDAKAEARAAFVRRAIERIGGIEAAAEKIGVTRAAIWRWENQELSVEAALWLAKAAGYEYDTALRHATWRLGPDAPPRSRPPKRSQPLLMQSASP